MTDEKTSLPEVFCQRMQELLGEEAEEFFASYDKEREFGLRYNPLKFKSKCEFEERLLKELGYSLSPVPWCAEGYYYDGQMQPGKHPWHEVGAYYIQEPSAMSAVEMLEAMPGDKICDLCAAPGGKTTQIAGKMQGKGLLVSNEFYGSRAKVLAQNVERLGIANAVVLNEPTGHLAEVFPEFFDKILVDAPCSGEGMFRKEPQAIQEWSLDNVALCARRQQEILGHAAGILKSGGVLVYSTCTFAPEENEQNICHFLEMHPEFSLVKSYRLWPHKLRGEGHFLARLKKDGIADEERTISQEEMTRKHRQRRQVSKDKERVRVEGAVASFRKFQEEALRIDVEERMSGKYVLFAEELYLLPEQMIELSGLKVVRAGLHLGTCKKNRFEPSHALAMHLHPEEAKQCVDLAGGCEDGKTWDAVGSNEAVRYLHGETISCDCRQRGWTLVCVDGLSLGWGKAQNGIVKNHYPKGLRICY